MPKETSKFAKIAPQHTHFTNSFSAKLAFDLMGCCYLHQPFPGACLDAKNDRVVEPHICPPRLTD